MVQLSPFKKYASPRQKRILQKDYLVEWRSTELCAVEPKSHSVDAVDFDQMLQAIDSKLQAVFLKVQAIQDRFDELTAKEQEGGQKHLRLLQGIDHKWSEIEARLQAWEAQTIDAANAVPAMSLAEKQRDANLQEMAEKLKEKVELELQRARKKAEKRVHSLEEKLKEARAEAAEAKRKLKKEGEERKRKEDEKQRQEKEERRRQKRKIGEVVAVVAKLRGCPSEASTVETSSPLPKARKLAHLLMSSLWPSASVAPDSQGKSDALREESASQIFDWLLVGGKFAATSPELRRTQVTHVLNCSERVPFQTSVQTCNMPVFLEDEPDEDLSRVLETAVAFLDEVKCRGGRCLVNCRKGMSRSVSIVLAYLVLREDFSLQAAWRLIKTQRPVACPNTGFRRQLLQLEQAKRGSFSTGADFA